MSAPVTASATRADGSPLRVLLVSHYYPPHLGGIEGVVHQEAVRLAAAGAEVTVLTSGPRSSELVEQGVTVVRVASWNGFEPHGIPFPIPRPSMLRLARRWAGWADVVHVHDSFYIPCWAAWFGAATTGTPLTATQHVALSDHPLRVVELIQRLVYAVIGKRVIRRARTVFTVNGRGAAFARELGAAPEAIRHLPNGADTELFAPVRNRAERDALRDGFHLPREAVLVLFVGRLLEKKGVRLLLESADPAYQLVFAGPGEDEALRGRPGVHLLGPLPAGRIAELMRACDVFALPTMNEGFPLTVQEAMSSALPVVTTDDPGYAPYELDRDQVALIARAPDALRAALRELALQPERRAAVGEYSRAYAEKHFAWAEHVGALVGRYRSAIGDEQR
jgi:glycosyltransferase involved in cell wall biosynthesis